MLGHLGYYNTATSRTHVGFQFSTHAATGGNIAPLSSFEAADLRIYRAADGAAFSATQRSSASGITMTSPFDSLTGLHDVDIDLTDNTDSGFYASGYRYTVMLCPDTETVDGQTITGVVLCFFEIGPQPVLLANSASHGGSSTVFTFSRLIGSSATSNTACVSLTGNGSGAGFVSTGGATGYGANFVGGATSGYGIIATATGGYSGARFEGQGSGSGISAAGGATGSGVRIIGGSSSGYALHATTTSGSCFYLNPTDGHALICEANGTGAVGIRIMGGSVTGEAIYATTTSGVGVRIVAQGSSNPGLSVIATGGDAVTFYSTSGAHCGLIVAADGSGDGAIIQSFGTGQGLVCMGGPDTGGSAGHGILALGSGNANSTGFLAQSSSGGYGFLAYANTSEAMGVITAGTNKSALKIVGNGSGPAMDLSGSTYGFSASLAPSVLASFFDTDSGTDGGSAVSGSVAYEIITNAGGSSLTLADIADAVWDEATSGHTTSGTTGKALTDAGSAGDPWSTALPGAYSSGTAGYILGTNLNATISSRGTSTLTQAQVTGGAYALNSASFAFDSAFDFTTTQKASIGTAVAASAVASVTGNVGGNVTGSVGSVTGNVGGIAGTTTTLDALQTALNSAHGAGSWATATGFSTHSAADVWGVGTRELTAGTNIVLAKGTGITGFNDLSAAQVNDEVDTALADYDAPTDTEMLAAFASLSSHGDGAWATATSVTVSDKTGFSLSSAYDAAKTAAQVGDAMTLTTGERDSIATALLDLASGVETGETVRQFFRLARAALLGKSDSFPTGPVHFRDRADSKDRITATVDSDGNRSIVTTDAT